MEASSNTSFIDVNIWVAGTMKGSRVFPMTILAIQRVLFAIGYQEECKKFVGGSFFFFVNQDKAIGSTHR